MNHFEEYLHQMRENVRSLRDMFQTQGKYPAELIFLENALKNEDPSVICEALGCAAHIFSDQRLYN